MQMLLLSTFLVKRRPSFQRTASFICDHLGTALALASASQRDPLQLYNKNKLPFGVLAATSKAESIEEILYRYLS